MKIFSGSRGILICPSLLLAVFYGFGTWVLGQETKEFLIAPASAPEIIGSIDTGDSLADRPLPVGARTRGLGKARTIFQRVAPPAEILETPGVEATRQPEAHQPAPVPKVPSFLFTVEAIWHPNQTTLVKVHHQKGVYQFWSNLDWRHVEGIAGIRDGGQEFRFLLFPWSRDLHETARENPKEPRVEVSNLLPLSDKGPHFSPTVEASRGELPAPVLDFLQAAHELYFERGGDLVAATEKRQVNRALYRARQEEAARSVFQQPEDLVVRFWHGEPKPLPPHLQPKGGKAEKR